MTQTSATSETSKHYTVRPVIGVAAHVCYQGKVLAFRRIVPHGHDTWTVMGGHLEQTEHWYDCALREVMEEAGISVHSPQLFAVTNDVFPPLPGETAGRHYVTLHVAVKADTPDFTNAEPDKHADLGWYAWHDLPQPRFRCIQSVYDQNLKPPYLSPNPSPTVSE